MVWDAADMQSLSRPRGRGGRPSRPFGVSCRAVPPERDPPPRADTAATLDTARDAAVRRRPRNPSKNRLAGDGVWEMT